MAMIKCSECGTEVSSKASACPKCACPIAGTPTESTQTIEQTSKRLKLHYLIASVGMAAGILIVIFSVLTVPVSYAGVVVGAALAGVSMIWVWVTRVRIWWHHK